MTVAAFSIDNLQALVDAASRSPRRRQHFNMHSSFDDPCQRLLNAIGIDSYIRPHRHSLDPKMETLIAVQGKFARISFDDSGAVTGVDIFGTEKHAAAPGLPTGVEVAPETWHTVLALVPRSVLLEIKAGPFLPGAAKEPASWAPEEDSGLAIGYLESLKAVVSAWSTAARGHSDD